MRSLPPGERERRQLQIAPLFAYLYAHHHIAVHVVRAVAEEHGETMTRTRLTNIRYGRSIPPNWLIPGVCRALGVSVTAIMGKGWVHRYGEKVEHKEVA